MLFATFKDANAQHVEDYSGEIVKFLAATIQQIHMTGFCYIIRKTKLR